MQNDTKVITDVSFTEKKNSPRPADAVIIGEGGDEAREEAHRKLVIEPFPDGHVFKYQPHPTTAGAFVLFNIQHKPVAVVGNQAVADLICQAVQMLFAAAALAEREGAVQNELKNSAANFGKTENAGRVIAGEAPSPVMES